jgi:hypothetical protein
MIMEKIRLNPMDYPLKNGESWWTVHPNDGMLVLKIPVGAPALSIENFLSFKKSKIYEVTSIDDDQGWVTVKCSEAVYEMPRYLFVRNFDAVPFIRRNYPPRSITRPISDENLFTDEE